MCDPITIGLSVAAASTVSSIASQSAAYSAQKQANTQNANAAMDAMRRNLAENNIAGANAREDAGKAGFDAALQAEKAQATAQVAAAEAGVQGNSVDSFLQELRGEAAMNAQTAEESYLRGQRTNAVNGENIVYDTRNNIRNLPTPQRPDYIGSIIGGASTGLTIANGLKAAKAPTKTT